MSRVRSLPRIVPAAAGKPRLAGAAGTQRAAQMIAREPQAWDAQRAVEMGARFDALAPSWDDERGGYRLTPLEDALDRAGQMLPDGVCVEIGAGTGILTRRLVHRWPALAAVDLSAGMLSRSPHPWRIRADAARLPIRDACVATVVIGDAPLFAAEVTRVTASGSGLLWVNALGHEAPFHLSPQDLLAALDTAGGSWEGVHSQAGWGSWIVLRRTDR